MPGMDGWEVLRELKADAQTRDIPVLMVTMTDDRELGYALGATEFLTKPVDRGALVQLLQRHAPEGADRRALVVDDKSENREVLRRALENEGWQVSEAENGRVALQRVADHAPALILLDLMMPVMDGFDFVMEMRNRDASRAVPIVVVTAKDVTEEDRRRLNGDVVGLIERGGLGRDDLLALLREQVAAWSRRRRSRLRGPCRGRCSWRGRSGPSPGWRGCPRRPSGCGWPPSRPSRAGSCPSGSGPGTPRAPSRRLLPRPPRWRRRSRAS